ncbi:MAG: chemotaxis protein CheD [Armatimonadetes bacterium]|nr:chemotaxis protein CheD [Armatimonadota bacterium]MCX7968666.1 chemotaxis protein CheD [Armatimonadota bacterium]MDW8143406.1 chemotaxis protein CheD [Armatimonadota bacterium]
MATKERVVNLGEIVVTDDQEMVLTVPGIGSCVVVCVYHPKAKLAGMAHVVLPSSQGRSEASTKPFWFADIAVPHLLKSMAIKGAIRPNCAIVGGAKVLSLLPPSGNSALTNIGEMNVKAVLENLNGTVNLVAQIVGGNSGLVARFQVSDGTLFVKDKDGQIRKISLSSRMEG